MNQFNPLKSQRTFTVQQVAQYLQVNRHHVLQLLRNGILHGRKTGEGRTSKWRIPEESYRKYLAGYDDTSVSVD